MDTYDISVNIQYDVLRFVFVNLDEFQVPGVSYKHEWRTVLRQTTGNNGGGNYSLYTI